MTLTPSKYEVQLVYECPSCSIEHYATVDETRFPGGVLCYCGKKIKFKAIYGTKITKSLCLFIEGIHMRYWGKKIYEVKFGFNYLIF